MHVAWADKHWPPFSLQVLLFVALGELSHRQVGVQPMYRGRLEVFQEEAVAESVFYVRTHTATRQYHIYYSLGKKSANIEVSVMLFKLLVITFIANM